MIQQAWLILSLILFLVLLLEYLQGIAAFERLFRIIPKIFWLYFIPMVFSNLGLLPDQHKIYELMKNWGLLFALFLLLIGSHPKDILKLGKPALLLMVTGSLGIVLGAVILYPIFLPYLPQNAWQMIGPLAGSWVGGSLNMVAVASSFDIATPNYAPIIIVDTLVGYSWMAFLLLGAGRQKQLDHWIGNKKRRFLPTWNLAGAKALLDQPVAEKGNGASFDNAPENAKEGKENESFASQGVYTHLTVVIFWSLFFSGAALFLGDHMPGTEKWLPSFAWTIIWITIFALSWGFVFRRFHKGYNRLSDPLGSLFLSVLIAVIGAQGKITSLGDSLPLFLFGLLWILFHGGLLFTVALIFRLPSRLAATASQCNIGGVVSGPVVAEAYHKGLAPIALVMAVTGNIYGFYLAMFVTMYLRSLS